MMDSLLEDSGLAGKDVSTARESRTSGIGPHRPPAKHEGGEKWGASRHEHVGRSKMGLWQEGIGKDAERARGEGRSRGGVLKDS